MKFKRVAVALAALGLCASVAAQDKRSVFFVVSGGLTYGGDKVITTTYTDGTTYNIRAGNLLQLGTGLLWQPTGQPFSVQATVNYHFDQNNAKNGSARFERTPIELLAFYNGVPKWRFGGGVRWSLNPKARVEFDGVADEEIEFKDAVGGVIEVGYKVGRAAWVNGRVGFEQYEAERFTRNGRPSSMAAGTNKVSGSHLGVNVTWGF